MQVWSVKFLYLVIAVSVLGTVPESSFMRARQMCSNDLPLVVLAQQLKDK